MSSNISIIVTVTVVVLLAVVGLILLLRRSKKQLPPTVEAPVPETPTKVLEEKDHEAVEASEPEKETPISAKEEASAVPDTVPELVEAEPPPPSPPDLKKRLGKTRSTFSEKLARFWKKTSKDPFSESEWEELEEALLEADVGFQTVSLLVERVRERAKQGTNGAGLAEWMREECEALFPKQEELPIFTEDTPPKPFVITIVGVNGAGKTTSIGKLSKQLADSGKSVLLGAADTFRAGATSQLKVWADRVGAQFVSGRENSDPGAVAFDSVSAAKAREIDVAILDTAGRLHTKVNLMEELKKVHRVVKKVIPEAPHETWLILDGTAGQNSVQQAREFCKALEVTGVIVTKLDGTAKGGAILAIAQELNLPVRYIGVGEGIEDLLRFEKNKFLDAIL